MAAVTSRRARFPESVWDVAVLRSLDARARGELEAAGRVRELREGQTVFAAGDPADSLFVVVEGVVLVTAVRRGDLESTVLRRAKPGDVFGEEAIVKSFATRAFGANAESRARVAEIPIAVLLRAVGRGGGGEGEVVGRLERALRRAATIDLFRATAFGRKLPDVELEAIVDVVRHVNLARGEHLYRAGDASTEAFFVADGLLSAQTEDDGKPRVEAYLSRGDLIGEDELEDREARRLSVVASGPAWLVAVPRDVYRERARKGGTDVEGTRRLRALPVLQPPRGGAMTTAHVFQDVYRLRVARSLLVIDQDSCIRCGHCAWSCASVHDDGIARLVRQGDKVIVEEEDRAAPLLVPNSCQHCKNPACMIDCPTGAIGRDARGEVFIREDLCTGCGACAKACPWDNIQIAKRKHDRFPEVAVKCDLCAGSAAGPACVAACPTEAIARVDPNQDFAELRAIAPATRLGAGHAPPPVVPSRLRSWPALGGGVAAAMGLALVPFGKTSSGWAAGATFVVLLAYSATKRMPRIVARTQVPGFARMLYLAHAAIGLALAGVTLAHTGMRVPQNAAGALLLSFVAMFVTGALGVAINVLVPPLLARLERESVLPEELAARARDLDERIFEKLTGRSELVKTLFGKVLRPYRRARFGGFALALSGRSLKKEERRVRARIDGLLEGKKSDRLVGLDDLVRLVVERRAIGAQAILTRVLRGWIPLHLAATGAAVVLLVLHVIAMRSRP